jgi:hypothetical protein
MHHIGNMTPARAVIKDKPHPANDREMSRARGNELMSMKQ